ncbi:vacuolar fusion protein MON1 homolog A [Lingula anatina]|uniref:Vacuolar fusion protein MON1 homolog n=1 Tax=Lingula anatina TaxID=7574 RepID=A0A1S3H631_LINAN|nr:vacuolar fusion protein MON1 homolog A [Lingula anatina]|eukprot:XP_013380579.1 vacuolar fusion protein MON1 homolog A [Lingula anatina]
MDGGGSDRSQTPSYDSDVPEPGAGGTVILAPTDSYADLTQGWQGSLHEIRRPRHSSGTISEITNRSKPELAGEKQEREKDGELKDKLNELQVTDDEDLSLTSSDETTASKEDEKEGGQTAAVSSGPSASGLTVIESDSEENVQTEAWRSQRKHIFVLSEAGKPIYSRYGKEDKLVTIMGVMQALVSFLQDGNDSLRCLVAGKHKFVFLNRENLNLVAVAKTEDSYHQLLFQLTYVYNQIISVLTYTQLNKIFKQRRNYDLRRLLTGSEKFIDNLLHLMDHEPSFLLGAVRCLPLPSSTRENIAQSIVQNANVKDLVFAILLANNQLITLVRMKKYFLHPSDLHLIINLVNASESFKAAESWTPICLPKFDASGFLHAYVSYLDPGCQTCLLLLTVDRDMFFTLSECRQKIVDRLNRYNCLTAITEALARTSYSISQVGIADLRHFMYKSKSTAQYTSPELDAPYTTKEEQERLFGLYLYLHHRIHSSARPLKILFHVGANETLLGWMTSGFELYTVFGPLVTKTQAITSINKLLKWIKREEDRLFILNAPTF